MSYQLKSKPRKNIAFGRAWKVTLVFCLLIFLISRISPTFFFRVIEPVARPLWSVREGLSQVLKYRFSFFISKKALFDENTRLKEELLQANLARQTMDIAFSASEIIKEINKEKNLIPARVISRPHLSPYDTLVVDTDGRTVSDGAKVFSSGNIFLGVVGEVFGKTAKVKLFSNAGVETHAEVAHSAVPLTLIGRGGGNFSALVPKDFPVQIGDMTVVPSYTTEIIAWVVSIEETEADSFKTLYLSYPVNIFEIPWVGISTNE